MKTIALLLLLLTGSKEPVSCDVLETNFVHDGEARLVLTQIMALDYHDDGHFHCEGWVLVRHERQINADGSGWHVQRTNRGYRAVIGGRPVVSRVHHVTWTQVDREIVDREKYEVSRRRFERMR